MVTAKNLLHKDVIACFLQCTIFTALYSNTTGYSNTANGNRALFLNTTGVNNTANGDNALAHNTTGSYNSANGNDALISNTTGVSNTANGDNALASNTTGDNNTANGTVALYSNTSGFGNTAYGFRSLYSNTAGSYNTATGYNAGSNNDANTSCSFFGYDADQNVLTDFSNSMALGNGSRITGSDQVRIGNASISSIGGYQNWTNISDGRYKKNVKEDVPGLKFIVLLKPITYNLNVTGLRKLLGEDRSGEENTKDAESKPLVHEKNAAAEALIQKGITAKEKVIYTGFVAQEVEAAAKKIGYDFFRSR